MGPSKRREVQPRSQRRTRQSHKGNYLSDPTENTELLTKQLSSMGLYAAATAGDGNCLFRALCDQLYGGPKAHRELRAEICDYLESHRERYEPFVDDERGWEVHLKCMRQTGTYGGHMELSAFAHLKKRNVKVIQPGLVYVIEWDTDKRKTRKGSSTKDPTVYVAYHDWEHFSSVRNLRGPHDGLPNVVETSNHSSSSSLATPPPTPSPSPSLRTERSPKRTFEESSAADDASSPSASEHREEKRTRSDTPSLGSLSNSSLSSLSSLSPSPPPIDMVIIPPSPQIPEKEKEPEQSQRPLTRRQRKLLGLPKPRVVGKGKIVIPGGRMKTRTNTSVPAEEPEPGQLQEWQRNGSGRVDLRGFRELKI